MSLEDEARTGHQLDATDEEMCKNVRDLVYSDKRIQVEGIMPALGVSYGSVSTILHGGSLIPLAMSKWQLEHQYAAPCWSGLGQKMIFFCVWWL